MFMGKQTQAPNRYIDVYKRGRINRQGEKIDEDPLRRKQKKGTRNAG